MAGWLPTRHCYKRCRQAWNSRHAAWQSVFLHLIGLKLRHYLRLVLFIWERKTFHSMQLAHLRESFQQPC